LETPTETWAPDEVDLIATLDEFEEDDEPTI
jgi:hypothetical protein